MTENTQVLILMHQKRPQIILQLKETHQFHSPNKPNNFAGYFLPADDSFPAG